MVRFYAAIVSGIFQSSELIVSTVSAGKWRGESEPCASKPSTVFLS
jgi:hypothetical protein